MQVLLLCAYMVKIKTDEQVAELVERYLPGFEYAGNYTGCDGRVDLRCKTCGMILNRSMVTVRHSKVRCRACEHKSQQDLGAIAVEQMEEQEKAKEHPCPNCGTITNRPIYCCEKCKHVATTSRRNFIKRIRMEEPEADLDITLHRLFERDEGICWLCGERCDYQDFTVDGNTFIAGNRYPSIDHVMPLSKGGRHTWDNVKLAHRICNTKKGNREIDNQTTGQRRETSSPIR